MDTKARMKALGFLCAAFVLAAGGCSMQPTGGPRMLAEGSAPIFDFPTECPTSAGMDACRAKLDAFPVAFGTERDRAPASGNKKPRVLIIAFQGTKDINASSPPSSPTLILHLANHGKVNTALYDLDPQSQADYYVTAKSDAAGKALWTLWRVPVKDNGSVTSVATGTFAQCQPPASTQWSYSIADFASCADAPHLQNASRAAMAGLSLKPFLNLWAMFRDPPSDTDGGWFSCDGGCCTMNMS